MFDLNEQIHLALCDNVIACLFGGLQAAAVIHQRLGKLLLDLNSFERALLLDCFNLFRDLFGRSFFFSLATLVQWRADCCFGVRQGGLDLGQLAFQLLRRFCFLQLLRLE